MANNVMLLGAPELSPENQAKVDAALAAIQKVREIPDGVDMFAAMSQLQMKSTAIFADPMLQFAVAGLRLQGRLRIPGEPR